MDQIKTGEFITERRKAINLTQNELAEKLNISNKTVSKWETGKGLPEVSLMLPLCEILGITVNELLSGEKIGGENYKDKAEENLLNILNERQTNKLKITLTVISVTIALICAITLLLVTGYEKNMSALSKGIIIVVSLIIILTACLLACYVDNSSGYFECRHCKKRFVPTYLSYVAGMHTITTRHLKCPYCNKVSWCKKRLSK